MVHCVVETLCVVYLPTVKLAETLAHMFGPLYSNLHSTQEVISISQANKLEKNNIIMVIKHSCRLPEKQRHSSSLSSRNYIKNIGALQRHKSAG